jgi:hypothetical protein
MLRRRRVATLVASQLARARMCPQAGELDLRGCKCVAARNDVPLWLCCALSTQEVARLAPAFVQAPNRDSHVRERGDGVWGHDNVGATLKNACGMRLIGLHRIGDAAWMWEFHGDGGNALS